MNPALRDSVAHVFVDNVELPELADNDEHHLSRVLRLRDGERVTVCDGKGSWRECVWSAGNVSPIGEVIVEAAVVQRVGVAFVPVKGDRNEWAVQKLTEIGVDDIVVLSATRRSVVRWTNEAKQMQKLRLVAREAAMQSRRTFLPSVEGLVALDEVMRRSGAAVADPDALSRPGGDVTLVAIGPEGGFDEDEISPSAARVSLGDTILRAETATLVAATLLVARRER